MTAFMTAPFCDRPFFYDRAFIKTVIKGSLPIMTAPTLALPSAGVPGEGKARRESILSSATGAGAAVDEVIAQGVD
jgi:hypothetical protein